VHGRIKSAERAARVAHFRAGVSRLCVGTTVIEVGVDVPEATVLIVDGAERLGLAQLHQLRGRVGRGAHASTCVLLARGPGAARAEVLARTQDGFEVAEEDLRCRGMGELAGLRQAGALGDVVGAGDPEADVEHLLFARDAVSGAGAVREWYLEVDAEPGADPAAG
jgi:ATP-dependent DNA helicase RecG